MSTRGNTQGLESRSLIVLPPLVPRETLGISTAEMHIDRVAKVLSVMLTYDPDAHVIYYNML